MASSRTELDYLATKAVVDGVDHLAIEMERKWGVGRLRLLVDDDLRERFDRQAELFNRAVFAGDVRELREHGPAMARAWQALDRVASEAGKQPLAPVVWETATGLGEVVAIVRSPAEATAVLREGRAMQVWTLEEVGRVIGAFPQIGKVKQAWPGATVTGARMRMPEADWLVGDELPI